MDDNTILMKGGDEQDIAAYAKQNGATYDKYTVVWDLETTGFYPPESKVIEIGANIITHKEDGTTEAEVKHWVLNHNIEIPEKIIEITGITKEIIDAEGRDPVECLNEFLPILMDAEKNVTHNGMKFDIPFLVGHCADILEWTPEKCNEVTEHLKTTAYDTAVYYKAKKINCVRRDGESYKDYAERTMSIRAFGTKYNLALCVAEEGIDTTDITFHRALGDVAMTYRLYHTIHKYEH